MKVIVITIQDDVCAKNGRDPEATALIEAARSFGKVESWDAAVAVERSKYQAVIDNMKTQLAAIEETGVTPEELKVLRAIREKSAIENAHFEKTIADRDEQLNAIRAENENRNEQIKNILGLA